MAKRRSNNPLPNWREKIAPDDQERWLPEETFAQPLGEKSSDARGQVLDQSGSVGQPLDQQKPRKQLAPADELNQGPNRAFMLQCRARSEARRLYGNQPVNRRFVEAHAAKLLRQWL